MFAFEFLTLGSSIILSGGISGTVFFGAGVSSLTGAGAGVGSGFAAGAGWTALGVDMTEIGLGPEEAALACLVWTGAAAFFALTVFIIVEC